MKIKQAVILASGKGTRMKPITDKLPKSMIQLNGKPLLHYLINTLKQNNIKDIIIIVNYKKNVIKNYFKQNQRDVKINFVEQKEPLGTANALKQAEHYIENDFIMMNGDVLTKKEVISKMIKNHKKNQIRILSQKVKDARPYGALVLNKKKEIKKIIEKSEDPPTNIINGGIYIFPKSIFQSINKTEKSSRGEYEITDSIKIAINSGVIAKEVRKPNLKHIELTYPQDIKKAERWIKNNNKQE